MLDIVEIPTDGRDLGVQNSAVPKAANVINVQLGSLEYAQAFGSDLRYFLNSEFQIQNESFKAYLIQRLTENQVNVSSVIEVIDRLFQKFIFSVDDADDNSGGLIA